MSTLHPTSCSTRDAAGNIVAIQRVNPAPISIGGFAPTSGHWEPPS
jgi:hypothetical protein